MENEDFVSVIINCLNGEKYLKEAIDSVYSQTYNNWEIILWDNASTDNSRKIALSYDNKVKYYCSKETLSLGEARNKAIKKAKGKFVAFLDCDDLWLPEKLEKQIPLFKNKKVGVVITDTIFFNGNGKESQLYKKKKPPTGSVFKELLTRYFISLETAILRREALNSLGHWFDKRFNIIEEYDLFVRVGLNWEIDYVDEVLAKWRVHNESWSFNRSDLCPKEKEYMLNKLKNIIPDFEGKYYNEVDFVKAKISMEKAMLAFKNGKNSIARSFLKPHLNMGLKYKIIYFSTYLPYKVIELIQKVRLVRP